MKVKIKLPLEVEAILDNVGNKTKRKALLKVYNALKLKSKYKNKEGYFEVSSRYFKKVNGRYHTILDYFVDNNIIEVLKREYLQGDKDGPQSIFVDKIEKVSYSTKLGICKRFRFLIDIDITTGDEYEIEFNDPKLDKKWYKKLKSSLNTLGYDFTKISRDRFGARVYHPLILDYKTELKDKQFCVIDAQNSQPRLIFDMMREKGIRDENFFNIFENDRDFYLELLNNFDELTNRKEAKELFMLWALGNGYTKGYNFRKVFPVATKFLENLKSTNHKDASRYLAWRESRIWIDDLLENLPTSFGIPVHDSLIVPQKDANRVLKYCQDKYPQIKFKLDIL
jgi:hypothetical protein